MVVLLGFDGKIRVLCPNKRFMCQIICFFIFIYAIYILYKVLYRMLGFSLCTIYTINILPILKASALV